jgi:hypothetical protein
MNSIHLWQFWLRGKKEKVNYIERKRSDMVIAI